MVEKMIENDPEMARFLAQLEQQERLTQLTNKLTLDCWDLCVTNPNMSKMDSKTESCLQNCVDRFLDTSTYIVSQFSSKLESKVSEFSSSGGDLSGGGLDSEMILDDKYSSSRENGGSKKSESSGEAKVKSGWKLW